MNGGEKQVERRKFRAAIGLRRRCSLSMTLFESSHYVRISCLGLVCVEHRLDNRSADFNSAFELKLKLPLFDFFLFKESRAFFSVFATIVVKICKAKKKKEKFLL